jgi:hypothetical protein
MRECFVPSDTVQRTLWKPSVTRNIRYRRATQCKRKCQENLFPGWGILYCLPNIHTAPFLFFAMCNFLSPPNVSASLNSATTLRERDTFSFRFSFSRSGFSILVLLLTSHTAQICSLRQSVYRISRTDLTFCVVYSAVAETPNRFGSTSHSERRASPSAENNARRFRSCDRMGVEFCRWSDSSPRHISTCKKCTTTSNCQTEETESTSCSMKRSGATSGFCSAAECCCSSPCLSCASSFGCCYVVATA